MTKHAVQRSAHTGFDSGCLSLPGCHNASENMPTWHAHEQAIRPGQNQQCQLAPPTDMLLIVDILHPDTGQT